MSGHFLIRKPRSIWPPLRNPRRYILHNFTSFIRTTEHKMIISAGWQLREAKRNQFENLHQFYLTESCYKNIFECPSYMRKIRQINGLVKFYFVTHILERLSIIWVVPRWCLLKPNGHLMNGNYLPLNCPCFLCDQFNIFKTFSECQFFRININALMDEKQANYQAKGYLSLSYLGVSQCYNCHSRNCLLNSEILSISCHLFHVLFYLMQEFAYSFNHAVANRLTE